VSNSKSDRRALIALVILCLIGAAAVIRRMVALYAEPSTSLAMLAGLEEHFKLKTAIVLLHIIPSLLFVLLVPLQFVESVRRRVQLHRWIGRIVMSCSVVLGVSALWLSAHPVGGVTEATATVFFGCFFLFCLTKAWWHIKNRRVDLHREWVTRMTAIAVGVATTRPVMGVFFATSSLTGLAPEQFFGPAMWLGLTATYVAGEAWISHSRSALRPIEARGAAVYSGLNNRS